MKIHALKGNNGGVVRHSNGSGAALKPDLTRFSGRRNPSVAFEAIKVVLSLSDNPATMVTLYRGVATSGIRDAAALVVGREGWCHGDVFLVLDFMSDKGLGV